MNAILHIERMGAQWDSLPRELPPRSNVDEDFKRWREDGVQQVRWNVLRRAAIWRTARNPIPASTAKRSEPPNKWGSAGTARAKESLAESETSRLIPGDFRWPWS
jgi:transposase